MDWRSLMQVKFNLEDGTEITTMQIFWPVHLNASFVENNKRYLVIDNKAPNIAVVKEVPNEYGKLQVTIPTPNPEETNKKDAN